MTLVKDPERAERINVDASIHFGQACSRRNIQFLFISTNYVFDGKNPPFSPDSSTGPVNSYGRQKVAAEEALIQLENTAILRIPLQYGQDLSDYN